MDTNILIRFGLLIRTLTAERGAQSATPPLLVLTKQKHTHYSVSPRQLFYVSCATISKNLKIYSSAYWTVPYPRPPSYSIEIYLIVFSGQRCVGALWFHLCGRIKQVLGSNPPNFVFFPKVEEKKVERTTITEHATRVPKVECASILRTQGLKRRTLL